MAAQCIAYPEKILCCVQIWDLKYLKLDGIQTETDRKLFAKNKFLLFENVKFFEYMDAKFAKCANMTQQIFLGELVRGFKNAYFYADSPNS